MASRLRTTSFPPISHEPLDRFPKFQGGVGGYARFIAICPPDWKYGVSVGQVAESPMPKPAKPLRWDTKLGMRVR